MNAPETFDPFLRCAVRDSAAQALGTRSPYWSEAASAWVITRFADAQSILHDRSFVAYDFHSAFARIADRARLPFPHLREFLKASLIFTRGQTHETLRVLMSRTLNHLPLSTLAPRMDAIARDLWQAAAEQGRSDIVLDYAEPLPSLVIAHLLGLTESERAELFELTYGLAGLFNRGCSLKDYAEYETRLAKLSSVLAPIFDDRRAEPRGDGTTRFLQIAARAGLSDAEVAAAYLFLYIASVDQTSASIGLGVQRLLFAPDTLAALQAGEIAPSAFVEELLRLESPALRVVRVATKAAMVGGVAVDPGAVLMIMLFDANYDSARFREPQNFTADGCRARHLAFAAGAHSCIGASFARAELLAALAPVIDRPPTKALTISTEWWPLDVTRRMRSFEVEF